MKSRSWPQREAIRIITMLTSPVRRVDDEVCDYEREKRCEEGSEKM